MDISEAAKILGQKGGHATMAKMGREFFARIGAKGGATVAKQRDSTFFSEIGKKGGAAMKAKCSPAFYSEIGKKGGKAVIAQHGTEHMAKMNRLSVNARHAKRQEPKA